MSSPPPSPPPPPKPKVLKKKRPLKATEPGTLDTSPGFRAPRIRGALAAAAAFEAEAGVEPVPQSASELEPGRISLTKAHQKVSEPPRKRRRASTIPGQAESPPMVTYVDSPVRGYSKCSMRGGFYRRDRDWVDASLWRECRLCRRKRRRVSQFTSPCSMNSPLL